MNYQRQVTNVQSTEARLYPQKKAYFMRFSIVQYKTHLFQHTVA
jgi:hypothetical protein